MHKGVILLLKAVDSKGAEAKTRVFMNSYEDEVWDWYEIGGRWTGTLDNYDPEKDPDNIIKCEYCGGTGDRSGLGPPEWKEKCGGCNACQGKGKRVVWPTQYKDHNGDITPLKDCIDVVKEWHYDHITRGKEEQKGAEKWLNGKAMKNDYNMYGYALRKAGSIFSQDFCFEANIYNVEKWDYSIPEDLEGWFAVIVDMHN
jgi:hypothetical protein